MRLLRDIAAIKRRFARTPRASKTLSAAPRFPRAYRPKTGNMESRRDKAPKRDRIPRGPMDRAWEGIAPRPVRNLIAKARRHG